MKRKDMHRDPVKCAPWGEPCPIHNIHHQFCRICLVDCTMGTHEGPPTLESDGIRRCYKCNEKLPRCQYIGDEANVAIKAVQEYRREREYDDANRASDAREAA